MTQKHHKYWLIGFESKQLQFTVYQQGFLFLIDSLSFNLEKRVIKVQIHIAYNY